MFAARQTVHMWCRQEVREKYVGMSGTTVGHALFCHFSVYETHNYSPIHNPDL